MKRDYYTEFKVPLNMETLKALYKGVKFEGFINLTNERASEIDAIVEQNRYMFNAKTLGYGSLMTHTAERVRVRPENYGLQTDDEKIYFYIKMVDPNLAFLKVAMTTKDKEELKEKCLRQFYIYEPYIIYFENYFNKRFAQISLLDVLREKEGKGSR